MARKARSGLSWCACACLAWVQACGYRRTTRPVSMSWSGSSTDWCGWQGERTCESLEHDLRLTATHDGYVHLVVQLRETSVPGGWSNRGGAARPGEEITRAAQDVAALLAPPER